LQSGFSPRSGIHRVHGALTSHVTPSTLFPNGSEAFSTVQVKSAGVGGVAPWQSWNLMVKIGPGVSAAVLATPSRSAKSRSFGDENAPEGTFRMLCLTLRAFPLPGMLTCPSG